MRFLSIILFLGLLPVVSVSAQTKKIAWKSHSGNMRFMNFESVDNCGVIPDMYEKRLEIKRRRDTTKKQHQQDTAIPFVIPKQGAVPQAQVPVVYDAKTGKPKPVTDKQKVVEKGKNGADTAQRNQNQQQFLPPASSSGGNSATRIVFALLLSLAGLITFAITKGFRPLGATA